MKQMRSMLVRFLIVCMALFPVSSAAGMFATDAVLAPAATADRGRVLDFVARADVQKRMQQMGIDPEQARLRINALTEEEVRCLAGHIDTLPAGASDLAPYVWGLMIGVAIALIIVYWK